MIARSEPMTAKSRRWWYTVCSWLQPVFRFIWLTLIVGLVVSVASTWLTTRGWNIDGTPLAWIWLHWFPLLVGSIGLLIFTIIVEIVVRQHPSAAAFLQSPAFQQNRAALLKRVRAIWIDGLLKHSLHHAARIDLNLQEQPDVILNPWRFQVQETNQAPHALPAGTSIAQVYDASGGDLLILGEPGAGKTTLLLELAQTLLERAGQSARAPVPVVFNLSSWAEKRHSIDEWMNEELWSKYQISRRVGRLLLETNQILPLLDGLDEMSDDARRACVAAINTYCQQEQGQGVPRSLVVCCRDQEYRSLLTRIRLGRAVSIQPLTNEQIQSYLNSAHGQLEALRQALRYDQELAQLAQRPLMLSIFTLAYQGAPATALPTRRSRRSQQQQLFATYVDRMLSRRGECIGGKKNFMGWLTFLARQMAMRHETVFSEEKLQPGWLENTHRRFAQWSIGLAGGLPISFVIGLLVGLAFGMVSGLLSAWSKPWDNTIEIAVIVGLIVGFYVAVAGIPRPKISLKPVATPNWFRDSDFDTNQALALDKRRSVQLFKRVLSSLEDDLFPSGSQQKVFSFIVTLRVWIVGGVVCGLAAGFLGGWLGGQIGGQSIGLVIGHNLSFKSSEQFSLYIWRNVMEFINQSTQNLGQPPSQHDILVVLIGLAVGITALIITVIGEILADMPAFLQFLTLRLWLRRTNSLPWNLPAFLEEAEQRLILRKAGGNYLFVHRLLLDYLASLDQG